ncbi:hypothetical protein P168DRAFT_327842 [Aspergillus campestris IBT 28561]|uniref:Uncharacterized protein n=1 Tax=Aspergillus campestris (strain IBT 28561) TaxID=1392248 RepID=A0A2I1D1P8_ASPC2|nr:uncharacterized protein P168DRAFT_327842 [Aspergillus campestris IBT 28561]PKY03803.1 hypothetical protein P168DRAFT_327842 [Aspergillus campestris IBT 28561]
MALNLHKDRLSADELDLKDPYITGSLGFFVIHNVIRRNLTTCAEHMRNLSVAEIEPYITYAKYTLHVTLDQIISSDELWFPMFADHDNRFTPYIVAHEQPRAQIVGLRELLSSLDPSSGSIDDSIRAQVTDGFTDLYNILNKQFDEEETLVNGLGRQVPLEKIQALQKKQEERRKADVKTYGHLWTAVYLLRSLELKEREIFPPGVPKFIASAMLTAGGMQYKRELQFAPKV